MDLTVELCGTELSSPLMLGSGGLGESAESIRRFQVDGCGAVVIRTLRETIAPDRAHFPSPHLAMDPRRRWLLNCEWGNLRDLGYWTREGIPSAAARGVVIGSVSGRDPDDCAHTLARLAGTPLAMVEINFSCSHAGQLFGRVLDDPQHVAAVVGQAKATTAVPIVAKLGWSPVLERVAAAAEAAGADAICLTNSLGPGLDLDIESGRPRLGVSGGFGGLSGPAIFPIALECVRRVATTVSVPVIGVGGISTADDVVKMLMAGARCVQVYTAAMWRGPDTFTRLHAGVAAYLRSHGHRTLADIRGAALPYLAASSYTSRRLPIVAEDRCVPCGACERICPTDAIQVGDVARVDEARCTGCGICVDACPPRYSALALEDQLLT